MECGKAHAILNNTVWQSDQEDFIIALFKMVATAMGSNIAVRQSPAYTSQEQGSVEHFHWLVKRAAYLLNRYSVHSDGNTSYYRRWSKEHKTPICEFGETVLYMLPTAKHMTKMEARFWPGKDTSTNQNILGISNKVVKARTIRRQIKPDNYNKQMMDVINAPPAKMTTTAAPSIGVMPQPARKKQ